MSSDDFFIVGCIHSGVVWTAQTAGGGLVVQKIAQELQEPQTDNTDILEHQNQKTEQIGKFYHFGIISRNTVSH